MTTRKFNQLLVSLGVTITLLTNAYPQASRTVMVQSNSGVLLFPTNLWSANASSARSGLSLATHATNPVVPVTSGGSGATNAAVARTNLGIPWPGLTNTNAGSFLSALNFDSGVIVGGVNDATFEIINDEQETVTVVFRTNNSVVSTILFDYNSIAIDGNIRFSAPSNAAIARTNFGLGWPALTNTNSAMFQTALFGAGTNPVLVNSNGTIVIANTNTNSIAITNPVVLSGAADITTVSGRGATLGSFTVSGNTNTNTWATSYDGTNYFSAFSHNGSQLIRLTSSNIDYSVPISFATNTVAAQVRTNLSLGWSALTNTNDATFQAAIFTNTNTAPSVTTNFAGWISIKVGTLTNNFRVPVYQ